MNVKPQQSDCVELEATLVDFADDALSDLLAERVRSHTAGCENCRGSLMALREVPAMLFAPDMRLPEDWQRRHTAIMAAVDRVAGAERAGREGFDVRILLPLAAALLIAIAGVLSLQPGRAGVSDEPAAHAAFALVLADPDAVADLAESLGVGHLPAGPLWHEIDAVGGLRWQWGGAVHDDMVPEMEDFDDAEVAELMSILGIDGLV